jgi:nitrogen-specific signal transduction histidine kinase
VAVGQSFDEIERVLPASIAIEFVPEVGLPRVSADRSQMEQVLMNLCPAAMAGRPARTVLPRSGSIADGCLTGRCGRIATRCATTIVPDVDRR